MPQSEKLRPLSIMMPESRTTGVPDSTGGSTSGGEDARAPFTNVMDNNKAQIDRGRIRFIPDFPNFPARLTLNKA